VDTPSQDAALTVVNASSSSFEIWSRDVIPSGENQMKNSAFNFIAVGPRT
jgi:hypothetical protein